MADRSKAISTYIHAKDSNRTWLMQEAFEPDARLEMVVETDAISFPSECMGVEAIAETLGRQFSRDNENVYTFCLSTAPEEGFEPFDCDWLVGMSKRDTGDIRIGYGQYNWIFSDRPDGRIQQLTIKIGAMQVLQVENTQPIMRWLSGLTYPWCPAAEAVLNMPELNGLASIADFLSECAVCQDHSLRT